MKKTEIEYWVYKRSRRKAGFPGSRWDGPHETERQAKSTQEQFYDLKNYHVVKQTVIFETIEKKKKK